MRLCGVLALFSILCVPALSAGCASLRKVTAGREGATLTAPLAGRAESIVADQQGGVNVAGVTGIRFEYAMPLGLTGLLLFIISLSHRREVLRIKRNGRFDDGPTK